MPSPKMASAADYVITGAYYIYCHINQCLTGLKDFVYGAKDVFKVFKQPSRSEEPKPQPERKTRLQLRREQANSSHGHKSDQADSTSLDNHGRLRYLALRNGIYSCVGVLFFKACLLPFISLLFNCIFGEFGQRSGLIEWSMILLTWLYGIVWVAPFWAINKVVNTMFFQEIANSAFKKTRRKTFLHQSISIICADLIFSFFSQTLYLVEIHVCSYLPDSLSKPANILLYSLLYSLYSFEYTWSNLGWPPHMRIAQVEHYWAYYVGFSLPLAVMTSYFDSVLVNGAIFSAFFPLCVISASMSPPPPADIYCLPLHVFAPSLWINNTAIHLFAKLRDRQSSAGSELNYVPNDADD